MLGKDLKNIKIPLTLRGRTFEISFDFNSMAELEDIYECGFDTAMKSMAKGKKPLKTIRALIYAAIKPRYPKITLMEVGELLTEALQSEEKMEYISETLKKALTLFMPEPEEEIVQGEQKPQPITKPITKPKTKPKTK